MGYVNSGHAELRCILPLKTVLHTDQLASEEEANWSKSALFVIGHVNLYQPSGLSSLTGDSLSDSVEYTSDWCKRLQVRPPSGWQHSFVETDHEIFSMVILSLPLIQEG